MTFISYAQNYEDIVLWRALGHIENGFYVDVGAADPEEHSVTLAFYERGWSGINIEPVREHFLKLEAARPRDLNLCAAAASEAGVCLMHVIPGTGLSTSSADTAAAHVRAGWQAMEVAVPALPLSGILRDRGNQTIHFLKIDVETAEKDVLAGIDLELFRPWIILVESTAPLSTELTSDAWEHILLQARYQFAYFDGLNRFYVANECSDLAKSLAIPPNVFDDFALIRDVSLRAEADHAQAEVTRVTSERDAARDEVRAMQAERIRIEQVQAEAAQAWQTERARLEQARADSIAEAANLSARLSGVEARAASDAEEYEAALSRLAAEMEQLREQLAGAVFELSEVRTRNAAEESEAVQRLQSQLAQAGNEMAELRQRCAATDLLDYRLQATLTSHSWRVTAPIRFVSGTLRGKLRQLLRSRHRPKPQNLAQTVTTVVERPAVASPAPTVRSPTFMDEPADMVLLRLKHAMNHVAISTP